MHAQQKKLVTTKVVEQKYDHEAGVRGSKQPIICVKCLYAKVRNWRGYSPPSLPLVLLPLALHLQCLAMHVT